MARPFVCGGELALFSRLDIDECDLHDHATTYRFAT
jgi:hypothetical protein